MRTLFRFLMVLVVIAVIAAVVIPQVISIEDYRERIETAASEQLDRRVMLAGDLGFSILPRLQVHASDVSIANAEGYGEEPLAAIAELNIAVKLIPLLSRRVEVDEFVLVDPVVRLENRGTTNNWSLGRPAEPAVPNTGDGGFERRPGALPFEASLGDVRLRNGHIIFISPEGRQEITGLDLGLQLPSLDSEAVLEGSFSSGGETLSLDARIGSIRDFFEGRSTPLAFSLGGTVASASFTGQFDESSALAFSGGLDMDVTSIRDLARLVSTDLPEAPIPDRLRVRSDVSVTPSLIDLQARDEDADGTPDEATVRIDDIQIFGGLGIALDGVRPQLTGSFVVPRLDVNPYMPEAATPEERTTTSGPQPWSTAPMSLEALSLMDADVTVAVGTLQVRDITVSDASLDLSIDNRRLVADLTRFGLYDGQGSARIVANGRRSTPSWSLNADLGGLNALDFMSAAAGFDRLEGTGQMTLALTSSGNSQASIMEGLEGSGGFAFEDGAIMGINVAETIRSVSSVVSEFRAGGRPSPANILSAVTALGLAGDGGDMELGAEAASNNARTDFTELAGTFDVVNGRATNLDLSMLSPLLRMAGDGYVDLPSQTLDYMIRPRLVASLEGQGGANDLQGVEVPVRLSGPFHDVSIDPDLSAVIGAVTGANNTASSGLPTSIEDVANNLLDSFGLGTSEDTGAEGEGEESSEPDPAELLQGLFGLGRSSSSDEDDDNGNN